MKKDGMLAAVAAAAGLDSASSQNLEVTASLVAEHFPKIATELRGEGAKAERERIAGIEQAALPGYEAIITAHKADATKTGADAALAIIAAEKSARAGKAKQLDDDETKLAGLKSTPHASGAAPAAGAAKAEATDFDPVAVGKKARAHIAEQASKGIDVSPEDAVNHILKGN